MIYIQTHFNLNRILMLAVGLWPYQRSKFIEFQMILFFGILTSFVIFQVSAIIQRYGNNAKRFTFIIILFAICGVFTISFLSIWPCILGVILPLKASRSRSAMQVVTEYFIDQEKYFYLILLHMNVTIYIGATAVIATGTMLMGYLKHICGMFSIARYRIEQAMKFDTLQNTGLEDENVIYKKLIYAVDIHRKAIEFSEFLISSFEGSLFLLIGVGVSCVTLSLYGVISHKSDVAELLFHFTGTTCTLVCIFVVNYAAQNVTDHNNDVFTTVYNVKWYMAPLNIQKMMLFLLQRGTKVFNLNIGGVFVASLESAATLTSLSISYFTVLYSTRK
ncbi:hypothetical protein X777_14321 [Ooceraea biroi]|uniref:Odorant receptor n=1 Tax=Ooceraea biroi TaxID=2015173 RepID=A0A026VZ74_OOCBI|nr:hypothetical protein X777_14321 [Ooceraea biroi]